MDTISFTVNREKHTVGSELDSDVSLNDYLRNVLNLRGTKYMCKEGGCGACVVAATLPHNDSVLSVNSCLVSVTSCQGWHITTVEGLGDRRKGYHVLQRTLAEYNGTQCGYCSPGWVMSMYSLLEANKYNLTQYEIENSFGSNTCRCTGYRPILDAFKSFATDAPKPRLADIEDLDIARCKGKEKCQNKCASDWCLVDKSEIEPKKIHLKDNKVWYRVFTVNDVLRILAEEGTDSYMLVNGNTGRGAVPILEFPRVLIDISNVDELKRCYIDQNLVIGAGTSLTDLMALFKKVSKENEEFSYLTKFYEHLDLVAHIPVRNIASIAGNLMTKFKKLTFSSDIFLLFESVGATLTIVNPFSVVEVTPEQFLSLDMTGRVITQVKLPPLGPHYSFVSFKIMPRAQNAHAAVNAAFLYEFDTTEPHYTVNSVRIVMGGLSAKFNHATETEKFLRKQKLFKNEVLQGALEILDKELVVEEIAGELKPEYRKKCALGLFYKSILNVIPASEVNPIYCSGAKDYRKTRPVSKGTEVYDTNPVIWPMTEPMPKVEALIQTAGEAFYVNDLPTQPREVFAAFVTADIGYGDVESIDPTPALKLPGVLAFFSEKDIPGVNSFLSQKILITPLPEEVFVKDGKVKYYDQAVGLIVAETEKLANRAALLVNIKYKNVTKPILKINEARTSDPSRVDLFMAIPERDRGLDVRRVIKGSDNILQQYHYSMETLSCVSKPNDDGIEVLAATQFLDCAHLAVTDVLNIPCNRVSITVPRCGGAFGIKITRASHITAACALATYLLNRPCRFVMSLQANMRVIGKRLPCTRDFEVGINNEGVIQYMYYDLFDDQGYVASEAVLSYGVSAVKNCYDSRRWRFTLSNVITDNASNTYCRAPGAFEAIAMTEMVMERISYEVDKDPMEVRLNNLNPEYPEVAEMVQVLLRDSEYYKRKDEAAKFNEINRWKKRGIRVALMSYPVSTYFEYHVIMSVYHGDATIDVKHGGVEMGQGINTTVAQVVAYTLNITMDKIRIKPLDSFSNPNNFATGGSRTTQAATFGAVKCCQLLLNRLSIVIDALNNPTWEQLIAAAHNRGINLQTSYKVTTNDEIIYRSAGAVVTEIELDILTGEHEVLRVDLIEDTGVSVNPEIDIGQVEGAFVMGLGHWTCEHFIYDEKTGELLTDRSWTYKVSLTKDIPIDFRVKLRRNSYNPVGTLGAKAVAEPPSCLAVSVAFALRAAIVASREDSGYRKNEWFNVDGPFTLEANVLKADVKLQEFLIH